MSAAPRHIQRSASSPLGLRKRSSHQADSAQPARESSSAASANLQRALVQRGRATAADLISAQKTLGNRALQRLLSQAPPTAAPVQDDGVHRLALAKQDEHDLRHAASAGEPNRAADPAVLGKIEEERGGGQPMDSRLSKQVGRKLGADFSGVRVHTGPRADVLNRAMNSKAFTVGRDIFFGRNAYRPDDAKGQHLIAHELVHVVQQGGDKSEKVQAKFSVAPAADHYERVADHAAPQLTPRSPSALSENARPAFGHETPNAIPNRAQLKPGVRAGVVQRAPAASPAAKGELRKAKDLRKGDIVLSRRRLLQRKAGLKEGGGQTGGQSPSLLLDGLKSTPRIPPGRAFEMVQHLWTGQLRVMNADFAHSALAMDQKLVTHTLDGKQIRRDSNEILSGSEVYRTSDKKLAENSVETTKQWGEIANKFRKAEAKAQSPLDLTSQSKSQAAILAAYALAGKLTPAKLFASEFTTLAHQATALMPGLQQLIEAEETGPGKGGRDSWGKAKTSQKGIQRWVKRNVAKIKLPQKLPLDPHSLLPEKLASEMHHLAVKSRPKWQFEGIV